MLKASPHDKCAVDLPLSTQRESNQAIEDPPKARRSQRNKTWKRARRRGGHRRHLVLVEPATNGHGTISINRPSKNEKASETCPSSDLLSVSYLDTRLQVQTQWRLRLLRLLRKRRLRTGSHRALRVGRLSFPGPRLVAPWTGLDTRRRRHIVQLKPPTSFRRGSGTARHRSSLRIGGRGEHNPFRLQSGLHSIKLARKCVLPWLHIELTTVSPFHCRFFQRCTSALARVLR